MMHIMNKIDRETLNPTLAALLRFVEFWSGDGKDVERVDDGFATTAVIFWMLVLKMVITLLAVLSGARGVVGVAVILGPLIVARVAVTMVPPLEQVGNPKKINCSGFCS